MEDYNSQQGRQEQRRRTMVEWQARWSNLRGRAEWTRSLIADVDDWTSRRHGEVGYNLSQFLSGHGRFKSYLKRINRAGSAACDYCGEEENTARQTIYVSPRWEVERSKLTRSLETEIMPGSTVGAMLVSPAKWELSENLRDQRNEDKGGRRKQSSCSGDSCKLQKVMRPPVHRSNAKRRFRCAWCEPEGFSR